MLVTGIIFAVRRSRARKIVPGTSTGKSVEGIVAIYVN